MITVRMGEKYGFVLKSGRGAIMKEDIGKKSQGYSQTDQF